MLLVLVFVPYLTVCLLADEPPHTRSLALSGWTRDLVTRTEASSDIPGATVLNHIPSHESDLAATAADIPRHPRSQRLSIVVFGGKPGVLRSADLVDIGFATLASTLQNRSKPPC